MSYEPPGFTRKSIYDHGKLYESSGKVGSTFISSEKPVANGAGRSLSRQDDTMAQRRNYKLLIDPALKKGSQKIFRFDGEFTGQPTIVPKDPRSRRTRIWTLNKADLPVPNFKVDKYYVGIPPQREVVFIGLNDNVDRKFLQEMCQKFGKVENIKIYYDPLTKKHTGKAKVIFDMTKSAKLACSKLNSCSVMGNIITTQLEPNLKGMTSRLKHQKSLEKSSNKESLQVHSTSSKQPIHYPLPPSTNSQSPSLDSNPNKPKVTRPVDPRIRGTTTSTAQLPDLSSSGIASGFQKVPNLSLSGHGSLFSSSLSSSTSSFEPISPPPAPVKDSAAPVQDTALEGAPPLPPPMDKTSSFLSYEDISPEQPYSPESMVTKTTCTEEKKTPTAEIATGKTTCDESKISKMIESFRKDSNRHSPPKGRSRSPKSEKCSNADYKSHEQRHNDHDDKRDKHRDRYSDYHSREHRDDKDYSSRRDSKRTDRYSDHRSGHRHHDSWKDSSYSDYKSRKGDYSRSNHRDDYDRRYGDKGKESSKYKRSDRYSTSPRRPEDRDRYAISPHRGDDRKKTELADPHTKEDSRTREWRSKKSPVENSKEDKRKDFYSFNREDKRTTPRTERSQSPTKVGKSPVVMKEPVSPKESAVSGIYPTQHPHINKYEGDTLGVKMSSTEGSLLQGNLPDVVRKRKFSYSAEDTDESNSLKKINIGFKSTQLIESESEIEKKDHSVLPNHLCDTAGVWKSVDSDTLEKEGSITDKEVNGTDLPQVEDISPCPSPSGAVAGNTVVRSSEDQNNLYSDIETNDDADVEVNDGKTNEVQDDDDDAMSLSSISSNEDTFELNEPSKKISPQPKPVTVPPPNMVFSFLPPIPPPLLFNPLFNPHVPPPMPFLPHPLHPLPGVIPPPPGPPPSLGGPPPIPPPSVLPPMQPTVSYSSSYQHPRPSFRSTGYEYKPSKQEKLWNWKRQINEVLTGMVYSDLEGILSRDVFRKLVEASAFKSLEAWWENQKKPKPTAIVTPSAVNQTATVAQPSTSTHSTLLGPSPFDRSHSMAIGLRASLPKLPSFKRRAPDVIKEIKSDQISKSISDKTKEGTSTTLKRLRPYDSESEHDTEVEVSSREGEKRQRTTSSLLDDGDDDRSQSPWQHLDDEPAPPAMDVRISKGTDRRTSTGSSLYKTIYSSESEEESDSEAESEDDKESEEERAESEEEYESDSETDESDEESEEESEESDEEAGEDEKKLVEAIVNTEDKNLLDNVDTTMQVITDVNKDQIPESEDITDSEVEDLTSNQLKRTVETVTLSQTTNYSALHSMALLPKLDQGVAAGKDTIMDTVSEENENQTEEDKREREIQEITDKPSEPKTVSQSIASLVELDHSYVLAPREVSSPVDVIGLDQEIPENEIPVNQKMFKEDKPTPPQPVFPIRSLEQDDDLVYEFLKSGLEYEDAHYLKVGFDQLVQVCSKSVVAAKWSFHPVTTLPLNAPISKRRRQKAELGVRQHVTGCARAEGYYKLDKKEKAKYAEHAHRQVQHEEDVVPTEEPKLDASKGKQLSRENRATQRRLQSAVCNEDFGDILKFNKLRVRKKQLKFGKSTIHDWGLVALEPIAADEMVIEYLGEMIRQIIADTRERSYEDRGIGSSYMFRLDEDTIIDATIKGNFARFINHCCDPNCYAKVIALENEKKIVIYSKRDIQVNEEITYDYKFPLEDEKIQCLCGSPHCRGTLN